MTQKPETKLWKKLKSLTPEIHWTRFESLVSPGVPDLHGIFPTEWGHSISFWVELKCSEMKKVHLTPRQISWNLSYNKAGGNNFILVLNLSNRAIYIYSGSAVRELSIAGLDHSPLIMIQEPWDVKLLKVMLHPRAQNR